MGEMSENQIGDLQEYEARKHEAREELMNTEIELLVDEVEQLVQDENYVKDEFTPMIGSILKQWHLHGSITEKQKRAIAEHILSRESFM